MDRRPRSLDRVLVDGQCLRGVWCGPPIIDTNHVSTITKLRPVCVRCRVYGTTRLFLGEKPKVHSVGINSHIVHIGNLFGFRIVFIGRTYCKMLRLLAGVAYTGITRRMLRGQSQYDTPNRDVILHFCMQMTDKGTLWNFGWARRGHW